MCNHPYYTLIENNDYKLFNHLHDLNNNYTPLLNSDNRSDFVFCLLIEQQAWYQMTHNQRQSYFKTSTQHIIFLPFLRLYVIISTLITVIYDSNLSQMSEINTGSTLDITRKKFKTREKSLLVLLLYGAVVGIFLGCFTRLISRMHPPSRPKRFSGSSIDIATRV